MGDVSNLRIVLLLVSVPFPVAARRNKRKQSYSSVVARMAPFVGRDRTEEFRGIFDRMSSDLLVTSGAGNRQVAHRPQPTDAARCFNDTARHVSRELASLGDNIQALTRLIQQQTAFDDQASAIGTLSDVIKQKLGKLHDLLGQLAQLKEAAAQADGGTRKHTARHADTMVKTLQTQLLRASTGFKDTLLKRSQVMRDTAARRNRLSADRPVSFESALFRNDRNPPQEVSAESSESTLSLAASQDLQNCNLAYYRQRHEAVRHVEAAVREVGVMFQDFTRLVHEQDETIVRIDADVEESLTHVNNARGELVTYLSAISSNRGLILKVLGILFAFLLFFGFVVVR